MPLSELNRRAEKQGRGGADSAPFGSLRLSVRKGSPPPIPSLAAFGLWVMHGNCWEWISPYRRQLEHARTSEEVSGFGRDDRPSLSHEIIVVDNASTDGSAADAAGEVPGVRLIENLENRGSERPTTRPPGYDDGRYALLLNSDAVLTENALSGAFFACMENHPDAAMACGQL